MTERAITPSSSSSISAKCRSNEPILIQLNIRNTSIMATATNQVTRAASDVGRPKMAGFLIVIGDIQHIAHAPNGMDELGIEVIVDFCPQPTRSEEHTSELQSRGPLV